MVTRLPLSGRDPRFDELDRSISADVDTPKRRGQSPFSEELLDDFRDAARAAGAIAEPERSHRCRAIALALELLGTAEGRRLLSHVRMLRWSEAYAEADAIEKIVARTRVIERAASRRVYAVRRRCDEQPKAKGASA